MDEYISRREAIKRAGRFLTAREIVNAQADRLDWLRQEVKDGKQDKPAP